MAYAARLSEILEEEWVKVSDHDKTARDWHQSIRKEMKRLGLKEKVFTQSAMREWVWFNEKLYPSVSVSAWHGDGKYGNGFLVLSMSTSGSDGRARNLWEFPTSSPELKWVGKEYFVKKSRWDWYMDSLKAMTKILIAEGKKLIAPEV